MAGFLHKIKSASSATTASPSKDGYQKKKDDDVAEATPLERMLQNAGPLREDGSDRFFGFENFGNTCYCNSIVQALFYSDLFRDNVISYPPSSSPDAPNGTRPKVNVAIRPPMNPTAANSQSKHKNLSPSQALKQKQAGNADQLVTGPAGSKPEDKPDSPEYKKKQAMLKGPILELAQENATAYSMDECTFTGLKDIFLALIESNTRTGVLSPQRFLEIFKRDNEMFRNSMHQDAHEFYGLILNDVITNVEANARRIQERDGVEKSSSVLAGNSVGRTPSGTGWVHDIFEGVLTSETKCLTCETASQRDETFLDLSIDLAQHSSVTACLRKFSAEEMLCEGNKFHCDHCGGLQEAEKRMKVKRLPKVLTLHLKRFKYTEDYSRLQKLFHRVVYPYHLRMFNTTEDAEDADRLYELYAVVVHIGGNAYHGHYVSIIKTKDRGWLLFDDEMVEPVDKHFVRNFFGDKPGMATAYVLFYQETTFDKVREEQEREGMEEVKLATQAAHVAHEDGDKAEADAAPLKRLVTLPVPPTPEPEAMSPLAHARTAPDVPGTPPMGHAPLRSTTLHASKQEGKSRDDRRRERKEREAAEKAAEKAAKQAEKERERHAKEAVKEEEKRRREDYQVRKAQARRSEHEALPKPLDGSRKTTMAREEEGRSKEPNGSTMGGILDRSKRGSRSMSKKSFSFFHKDRGGGEGAAAEPQENGDAAERQEKRGRLGMGLGRKKSSHLLS
ncbi:ubiquitin hydrolase CreB [Drechmeria coniospora]|uniref:Ubiquitin carboxyl-terminal hydrolase n=1 Tax=Drechmeria coniospora TaxID=98403 RepID=A0A151GFY5_DRECN|nr:ubiquitin hydrolase CreB [Drechmeria coniospora]KYK56017.1 ubiquitin hydrolase CreB [Drechmeria coniospora]ODA76570.1 hypothetical protein RJ55_07840 [Drechmeria coniospora]